MPSHRRGAQRRRCTDASDGREAKCEDSLRGRASATQRPSPNAAATLTVSPPGAATLGRHRCPVVVEVLVAQVLGEVLVVLDLSLGGLLGSRDTRRREDSRFHAGFGRLVPRQRPRHTTRDTGAVVGCNIPACLNCSAPQGRATRGRINQRPESSHSSRGYGCRNGCSRCATKSSVSDIRSM